MANEVVTPLRTEPLFDKETGNPTIRFSTYLENMQNAINANEAAIIDLQEQIDTHHP